MNVFNAYAEYYDMLYNDKDYAREADYIEKLILAYHPHAKEILELGCGTGKHAMLLAQRGYQIHGVDISERMLQQANERLKDSNVGSVSFSKGDIRSFTIEKRFDAVLSLFHVMSYQTRTKDLLDAMHTANIHLRSNGLFIFDCWYGPAVLSDPPLTRIKRLKNDNIAVTRISEPKLDHENHTVQVNYQMFIENLHSGNIEVIEEQHVMRYLFKQEVQMLLEQSGFKLISMYAFLQDTSPQIDDWNCIFIAQKG